MGIYVNPGISVVEADASSRIYVDKSLIIGELNEMFGTSGSRICVSRPRRFGKTVVGNLISAYYTRGADSRALFEGLKLSGLKGWDARLNKCNVVKIDMNGFYANYGGAGRVVSSMSRAVVAELADENPRAGVADGDPLPVAVTKVYKQSGVKFVVIIDEYDVLVRERVSKSDLEDYLSLLNGLFKAGDTMDAVALAYITGILPIVRDKVQSKLNNFDEYTMLRPMRLAPYIGFTLDEVRELCVACGMDYAECLRWYDGYRLAPGVSVCNSNSVCKAMAGGEYDDYWNATGSYRAVSDYIGLNLDGSRDAVARMIGGGREPVQVLGFLNTLDDFTTKDDLFTYLIHLGYLAYDNKSKTCFIPNGEMLIEWTLALGKARGYKRIVDAIENSRLLLKATVECDEEAVARALDAAHQLVSSPLTYNNEGALQSAIGLAYFYASAEYNVVKELPAGRGFADMAFLPLLPGKPAMIVELKMDKNPDVAVGQARARRYADALSAYSGPLLIVGISYDKTSKRHWCSIEQLTIDN